MHIYKYIVCIKVYIKRVHAILNVFVHVYMCDYVSIYCIAPVGIPLRSVPVPWSIK